MSRKLKTYVSFVLDESGSMSSIRNEAISNFNEQLDVLKSESSSPEAVAKKLLINGEEYEGVETVVSFIKFNQDVTTVINGKIVEDVTEITEDNYTPNGTTALYDAIGLAIEEIQSNSDINEDGVSSLVVIITDGMENASKKFNQQKIKSLVDELQQTNRWTFTFMGTENALDQAYDIGFYRGNVASFTADSVGMSQATVAMVDSTSEYYKARLRGETSVSSFYSGEDD